MQALYVSHRLRLRMTLIHTHILVYIRHNPNPTKQYLGKKLDSDQTKCNTDQTAVVSMLRVEALCIGNIYIRLDALHCSNTAGLTLLEICETRPRAGWA